MPSIISVAKNNKFVGWQSTNRTLHFLGVPVGCLLNRENEGTPMIFSSFGQCLLSVFKVAFDPQRYSVAALRFISKEDARPNTVFQCSYSFQGFYVGMSQWPFSCNCTPSWHHRFSKTCPPPKCLENGGESMEINGTPHFALQVAIQIYNFEFQL